jgi:hypothetical protein
VGAIGITGVDDVGASSTSSSPSSPAFFGLVARSLVGMSNVNGSSGLAYAICGI